MKLPNRLRSCDVLMASCLALALSACDREEASAAEVPPGPPSAQVTPTAQANAAEVKAPPADPAPANPAPATPAPAKPSTPVPEGMNPELAAKCDAGDAAACLDAATAFAPQEADRKKMSREDAKAQERVTADYAQRGCDLGNGDACVLAAKFWRDARKRTAAEERACELGKAGACGDLGWQMLEPEELGRGLELLEKACRANAIGVLGAQPGAYCKYAAGLFADGNGHAKFRNAAKAKELAALGCQQGDKLGCPCKTDGECGGGEFFCMDNECVAEAIH